MAVSLNPRASGMKGLTLFNELHGLLAEPTPGQLVGIAKILEMRQRREYASVAEIMQNVLASISDLDNRSHELLFMAIAFSHLRVFVLEPETGLVHGINPEAWNFWADKLTREAAETGELPDPGDFPGFNAFDRRFSGCPLLIERKPLKDWCKKRSKKEVEQFARHLARMPGRLRTHEFYQLLRHRYPFLGKKQLRKLWQAVATSEMKRPGRPHKGEVTAKIDPRSDMD